jgi:hypothetical protein
MLIQHLFLTETVSTDSPQFRAWFGTSKVVDAQGNPLPVYHGTGRADRVGTRFRKARATAGPMSYFTDNPEIASGYAIGKPDTSHEPESDYEAWITVFMDGKKIPIRNVWWFLSQQERQTIAERAPHVRNEDDKIFFDPDTDNGVGNYQYALRQARGNVLLALVDGWLSSGLLFDDEDTFAQVLQLAGLSHRVWIFDPRKTMPFVYQVFLCIKNPLISTMMPSRVIDALTAVAAKQRRKVGSMTGDQWNKKNTDARAWIEQLLDKINSDHAWTVIPDWVTKTLISLGYDGIQDVGGKHGSTGHTVWIPFDEHQVKSAISNKKFDPSKSNIHQ